MGLYIGGMDKSKIASWIPRTSITNGKIYGIEFDGISHVGKRTHDAVGLYWEPSSETIAGRDDFRNIAPFNVKKCITQYNTDTNKREVLAYEGDSNYDSLVASKTGERMIEFPMFYFRRPSKWTFEVSPDPIDGFIPSPMHVKNGEIRDVVRVSEFICSSGYTSQPGVLPLVNTHINEFRKNLRLKGLQILDKNSYYMIVMLSIIKIASLNSQATIGHGVFGGSQVGIQILGDNIRGLDGYQTALDNMGHIKVMGIEDFYGHVWKALEGICEYQNYIFIYDGKPNIDDKYPEPINDFQRGWVDSHITLPSYTEEYKYISDIAYSGYCPHLLVPTDYSDSANYNDPIGDAIVRRGNDSYIHPVLVGGYYGISGENGLFAFANEVHSANDINAISNSISVLFEES